MQAALTNHAGPCRPGAPARRAARGSSSCAAPASLRRRVRAAAAADEMTGGPAPPDDIQAFKARLIASIDRAASRVSSADASSAPSTSGGASDVRLRLVISSGNTSSAAAAGAPSIPPPGVAGGLGAAPISGDMAAAAAAAAHDKPSRRVVGELLLKDGLLQHRFGSGGGGSSGEVEVELDDEQEAAAAQLLLQVMQSVEDPVAPLRGAPDDALLRVLKLAARLEVPCGVRAAGAALLAPERPLPWDAVLAALTLPTAAPELSDAARAVQIAAQDALQAELGDIDMAWADPDKRQKLLALPFEGIITLLTDGRTRVISECSIFYTADAWLHAHDGGSWTQQSQLAAAVRVPQLRAPYLLGVVAQTDWFNRFVAASEVVEALSYVLAEDRIRALAGGAVETPVLQHAAWHLPRRPRSAAADRGLRMEWDIPLEKLRRLHKAAVRAGDGRAAEIAAPTTWVYDGMGWTLELQADFLSAAGGVSYGLFVTPSLPPTQAPKPGRAPACVVTADITLNARCTVKGRSLRAGGRMQLLLGREGRGFLDMMEVGRQAEWDEDVWHAAGLVQEDGTVRVTARVRDVC